MEVQVQRCTVINDGGAHQLIPLNIFDLLQENIHVAILYAFTPPTPSNSHLVTALSQTLLHFPTLVAQLGYDDVRRPCFRIGDAAGGGGGGALVVEATVASDLSDHLPLEPSPDLRLLHPETAGAAHLLQFQINRFRCGGLVLGVTNHHKAADGQSMANFFHAWAQAVRGVTVDRLPVYDKSWLKRRDHHGWSLDFVPVGPEEEGFDSNLEHADPGRISNMLLHYSSEYITRELKSKTTQKYTTFEVMTAHLWRKITLARGLDGRERTMARISVNGRRKLNPPVSENFFGNLVVFAYSKSDAKQLITEEGGLEGAAKAVHDAILGTNDEYFRHVMELGASYEEHAGGDDAQERYAQPPAAAGEDALSPVVEVDSWLGFRFEDVDLGGGGKLCALLPTWLPLEGLVVFLPSLREGGGVDVFVTLLREHAARLREISH